MPGTYEFPQRLAPRLPARASLNARIVSLHFPAHLTRNVRPTLRFDRHRHPERDRKTGSPDFMPGNRSAAASGVAAPWWSSAY